jgi:hypothetical protein
MPSLSFNGPNVNFLEFLALLKSRNNLSFLHKYCKSQSDKDDKDGILTFSDTITGCLPVWKAIDGTQFQAFFS